MTEPVPFPVMPTLRFWAGAKLAVTVSMESIMTGHVGLVPEQSPPQLSNTQPDAADAVSVTVCPAV